MREMVTWTYMMMLKEKVSVPCLLPECLVPGACCLLPVACCLNACRSVGGMKTGVFRLGLESKQTILIAEKDHMQLVCFCLS
ncbi:hypothetical protein GQ457_12G008240 [Hibiscus cannabinus]